MAKPLKQFVAISLAALVLSLNIATQLEHKHHTVPQPGQSQSLNPELHDVVCLGCQFWAKSIATAPTVRTLHLDVQAAHFHGETLLAPTAFLNVFYRLRAPPV